MTRDLRVKWEKPLALSPCIATRLSPHAMARLEHLAKQSGNSKSVLMRELIYRAWQAEFREPMDAPA
jgi:hypothetical protein